MISEHFYLFFLALIPLVSFLYSTVGHGGASAFIALMLLFGFPISEVKSTSLILNLVVSGIAFGFYFKKGYFNLKLFALFALASIPASFLGARISLNDHWYKMMAGIVLLLLVARLFISESKSEQPLKPYNPYLVVLIGLLIGFISGLIGIGGGIFLSPVLLLLRWESVKNVAGISALFIWVNSMSGLAGHISKGTNIDPSILVYIFLAVLGAILGGYNGATKFSNQTLKIFLSVLLIVASLKLIFA